MAKKRKTKRKSPQAPLVAGVNLSAGMAVPETLEIHCPTCRTHWANATVNFGEELSKNDFAVRKDLTAKFQKNGLPICPVCDFNYTPMAMYALMMAAMTRKRMEGSWTPQYSEANTCPPPEDDGPR